ncbi:MAG: rod shape-determining protein MreD [Planctomycetaceae bacterium]|nr:rod shape-determining protein MreD [Planctomycetaceae bacterium]
MRWFSFITILFGATLLEAGDLLNVFAVTGWYVRPSILITLLLYYSLVCRYDEAIVTSFFIGFAADLASHAGVMGPHMLCYGILGVILNQTSQMIIMKRAIYKASFVFLAYMLAESAANWMENIKLGETREDMMSILFLTALYSAVISPLIWSVLSALSGWSNIQKTRADWTYH